MKNTLEILKPCFLQLSMSNEIVENMEVIRSALSKTYNLDNIVKVGIECNDTNIDKFIYFRYVEASKVIMIINNRILQSGILTPEQMSMIAIHETYFTLSRNMKIMYVDQYLRIGHPKVCPTFDEYRQPGDVESTVGYTVMSLYKTRTDLLLDNGINISYRDITNNEFVYDCDDLLEIYEDALYRLVGEGYGEIFLLPDAIAKMRLKAASILQEFVSELNLENIDSSNMRLLDIITREYNATSIKYLKDYFRPVINTTANEKSHFTSMLSQHLQRNEDSYIKIHEATYFSLTSDNKSNEIQKVVDEITIDLQNVESTDDKYNLLDKIHRHLKINDKIRKDIRKKINNGKALESDMKIYDDFDVQLNTLRGKCVEIKIRPKRYGIFAEYPEGYEG